MSNIGTLSNNVKVISKSYGNWQKSQLFGECKLILCLPTMYVYCVNPECQKVQNKCQIV